MKLLFYQWGANNEGALQENLEKEGHLVYPVNMPCEHYTRDMKLGACLIPKIHELHIEGMISFNYFPILSIVCNICHIPYYSWVYDCPHFTLFSDPVRLPCNHIGIFDRDLAETLKSREVNTVFHLPLAVDHNWLTKGLSTISDYRCDISFAGSLYTGDYDYLGKCLEENPDAVTANREDLLLLLSDYYTSHGLFPGEEYFATKEEILQASAIEKHDSILLRQEILQALCRHYSPSDFHLYTGSNLTDFPELSPYGRGTLTYQTQLPLLYQGSRINLNISLTSIHSGIPLRVLDIMACGGFCLSNFQPEMEDYFIIGKEIDVFHSTEECLDKIRFYLSHETQRQRIAEAGAQRVQKDFSYSQRLRALLQS